MGKYSKTVSCELSIKDNPGSFILNGYYRVLVFEKRLIKEVPIYEIGWVLPSCVSDENQASFYSHIYYKMHERGMSLEIILHQNVSPSMRKSIEYFHSQLQ